MRKSNADTESSLVHPSSSARRLILARRRCRRLLEVEVQLGLLPDAPRPGEGDVLLGVLLGDPAVLKY